MNETMKTILNRRSIRAYKAEQIKEEDLKLILEAGMYAPSAANQQSWHFTVVQSKEVLNKINQVFKKAFENSGNSRYIERAKADNFSIFYNAPTYIILSGDEKAIAPSLDAACALQNMFLAGTSIGIGSCWIHAVNYVYGTEEGKALFKELGVPEGYRPYCSASFGYAAMEGPAAPRKEGTVTRL